MVEQKLVETVLFLKVQLLVRLEVEKDRGYQK